MNSTELAQYRSQGIDPATLEAVVAKGDLSKLTEIQKVQWYKLRCEAAGLDPRTQPFQYLRLQDRLVLYATKAATDGLVAARGLTVEIADRRFDSELGLYEAKCRVTRQDGSFVEDIGVVSIGTLKGEALCNAVLKAVTKAKRRTVLSACGLGMLDETEIETIPEAQAHHAKNFDNGSGHGSGAYAEPNTVKQFQEWCRSFCEDVNSKWVDQLTDKKTGEIRQGPGEILSPFQLSGHLLKWARAEGYVNAPAEIRAGSRDKYAAVAWDRYTNEMAEEAGEYGRRLWKEAKAKLATEPKQLEYPHARASGQTAEPITQAEAEALLSGQEELPFEPGSRG